MRLDSDRESTVIPAAAPARGAVPHPSQLDGVRALAACFVVAHHAFLQAWPGGIPDGTAGVSRSVLRVVGFGPHAVDLFIALSGFCLALPVVRHGGLRGATGAS